MSDNVNIHTVKISTEFIKLDQFLKFSGICATGGDAKEFISNGNVLLNGEVCLMRGKKLRSGDKITADSREYIISNA